MAEDKAPYQLTVELDSSRPDALSKAMDQLRDIAAECDTTGKAKATIKFESYKQADLNEIMDTFEEWLYKFAIGLGCQMKIARPGLRPEMQSVFRERYATPMDDRGWNQADDMRDDETPLEGEPVITPDSYIRLALPEPGVALMLETSDGEYSVDGAGDDN
jgi:hypothetical protein